MLQGCSPIQCKSTLYSGEKVWEMSKQCIFLHCVIVIFMKSHWDSKTQKSISDGARVQIDGARSAPWNVWTRRDVKEQVGSFTNRQKRSRKDLCDMSKVTLLDASSQIFPQNLWEGGKESCCSLTLQWPSEEQRALRQSAEKAEVVVWVLS